ncbi:MAG TPA: beta-propeller fold lactonase family protein [Thermoanaerobaculia bacterium]|nr:beta-propeller fold lactonase family protein [Thermoanaerobaculia bacterium]
MILATILAAQLFVTNERAGTVQVIDTTTDRVVASTKIHDRPRGLAISPDGKRVYVAVSWWRDGKRARTGKERIAALDTRTLKLLRDYTAGTDPECVAVGPDGQRLYLSNEDAGTASIIDVASGKHLSTLVVGTEPEGVTATPDGKWVYVTAETSNVLSVIDVKAQKTAANILVDPRPRAVIFTRDSKYAWATAEIGGTVMLVDTAKRRVVKRIRLRAQDKPVGLVLSPDEKRLYVATGRGNGVAVLDTRTHKVLANIPTGERVWGIAIAPDGKKVYAANSLSNTVSVIDTATNRVTKVVKTDDGPWGLAVGD